MPHSDFDILTILGPTASGKTKFAATLAHHIDAEIISADSRQVYRRMDIGTGKDLTDYAVEGKRIPYHLIDIAEPGSKYNVYEYQHDFLDAYNDIRQRGKKVIVCGGTGLYLESILRSYHLSPVPQNPELRAQLSSKSLGELTEILARLKAENGTALHNSTDTDTPQRAIRAIEIEEHYRLEPSEHRGFPALRSLNIGLDINRDERRRRISLRLRQRIDEGMIDEVKHLLAEGIPADDLIYYGLEYKYLTLHATGSLSYDEMLSKLEIAIHQFAKRQMTWFRGMERRGIAIHWIDALLPTPQKVTAAMELIEHAKGTKEQNTTLSL